MNLPIELRNKTVLLAGCGGGYDVVCALPVALELVTRGCQVHLASASFTALDQLVGAEVLGPMVTVVTPQTSGPEYCPEVHLSRWLTIHEPAISPRIFCYDRIGVQPLKLVFDGLKQELGLDALLVVDGGVDGLFRGDEHDLGSPSIDAVSMVAGTLCSISETYYVMTAFGTEGVNKEVSHAQALERISDVVRLGGFHGVCALVPQDPVACLFDKAVDAIYVHTAARHHSNMVDSLRAGYRGAFGDTAFNSKTQVHPVWVSPLTSLYWFLDLAKTAHLKLYFDAIATTGDFTQVTEAVKQRWVTMEGQARRDKPCIPI